MSTSDLLAGRWKLRRLLLVVITLVVLINFQQTAYAQTTTPSCPAVSESLGTVTTAVTLPSTATYKIWSRMKAADAINNSYYLQVDSQCPITIGDSTSLSSTSWSWVDYRDGSPTTPVTMNLTGGVTHVVKLIGREPGVALDELIFSDDLSCTPSDLGTNCTVTPTATPPLTSPATSITFSPTVVKIKGDYNNSGTVDILDFNLWRDEFTGVKTTKLSDGNGDGVIDLLDFSIWLNAFRGT